MNIRKMKLALTVDLMNLSGSFSPVNSLKNSMNRFKDEVGSYVGSKLSDSTILGAGIERKTYALQFENVTLDLDLITNKHSSEQFVKGFNLKENFA